MPRIGAGTSSIRRDFTCSAQRYAATDTAGARAHLREHPEREEQRRHELPAAEPYEAGDHADQQRLYVRRQEYVSSVAHPPNPLLSPTPQHTHISTAHSFL